MIPFARIVKYGNTVAAPTGIKDFQANSTHAMVLGHDGTMWGFGTTTSGSMGTGSVESTIGWYKSNISGVDSFSSNMQNSTVALMKDGRVMVCGTTRADKFGGTIPTSNLDWIDVTDQIPQEVIDAEIKQIVNHSQYVIFLTKNNLIYSVSLSIGNTSTILPGTTWRKNTFGPDMNVVRIAGLSQSPSGPICIVQDDAGLLYGIGYNGYKVFASSPDSAINTYTKMGDVPYVEYSLADSGRFSTGVMSSTRSVYSGREPGPDGFNSTFGSMLKVGCAANTAIGFTETRMYGSYGQNQLPIAATTNASSGGYVIDLRAVPTGMKTTDMRFCCGNNAKNVYILYEDDSRVASLYCLGPNVGQGNNVNAQFIKVDLPPALLN